MLLSLKSSREVLKSLELRVPGATAHCADLPVHIKLRIIKTALLDQLDAVISPHLVEIEYVTAWDHIYDVLKLTHGGRALAREILMGTHAQVFDIITKVKLHPTVKIVLSATTYLLQHAHNPHTNDIANCYLLIASLPSGGDFRTLIQLHTPHYVQF
jgi:hypothetical protein